jgi:hypothetical protein
VWVAGIVEVFWSRRRRGEGMALPAAVETPATTSMDMPAYDAARHALVAGLIEDAQSHEAGRFAEIGRQLPSVRDRASRAVTPWTYRLQLALDFWCRWAQARDDRWHAGEGETLAAVAVADWPRYARTIASDLALDRDTLDPIIRSRFADVAPAGAAR